MGLSKLGFVLVLIRLFCVSFYFIFSLDIYNLLEEKPFKTQHEFEAETVGICSRLPYWALLHLAIRSVVRILFYVGCSFFVCSFHSSLLFFSDV